MEKVTWRSKDGGRVMDNTSWYRVSKDVELKNGKTVKIYRTVFETSDYSLSEESVEWCMKAMDRKTEDSECQNT